MICNKCQLNLQYEPRYYCDTHDLCTYCCGCIICNNCKTKVEKDFACYNCGQCTKCCECKTGSDVRLIKSPLTFWRDNSKRLIGVEIEVEGTDKAFANQITNILRKWKCSVVEDGSLRAAGYEINTAPANGKLFEEQILAICSVLKEGKAQIDSRCGLHIHIEAKDLNYYDLRNVVLLHQKLEKKYLKKLVGERFDNGYCKPVSVTQFFDKIVELNTPRNSILKTYFGTDDLSRADMNDIASDKYFAERYFAVNLASWFYRRTIEFRLPPGTVDPKRIIGWGKTYQMLVDYAKNNGSYYIKYSSHKKLFNKIRSLLPLQYA